MNTLYVCSIVFCVDIRFLVEAQKLQRDNARLDFKRDTHNFTETPCRYLLVWCNRSLENLAQSVICQQLPLLIL